MKNIHILPTDKPSRVRIGNNGNFVIGLSQNATISKNDSYTNQNIYITSDEEIKEGDWFIRDGSIHKCFRVHKTDIEFLTSIDSVYCGSNTFWSKEFCKKIILTTDQELIKDNIQSIPDEFLEWFIKNPNCEEVGLEKDIYEEMSKDDFFKKVDYYAVVIPKEESKQKCEHIKKYGCIKDICSCSTGPKQETLEEALDNYTNSPFTRAGFINGVNWQKERSYSEEEVLKLLLNCPTNTEKETIEWFQQFKIN